MTYSKPKLTALGDAARTIKSEQKDSGVIDGSQAPKTPDPAYDLDE